MVCRRCSLQFSQHEAPCSIHRFKLDRTRSVQFNLRFSQLTLSICIGYSPSHSHMWEVLLHMVWRRCSLQFSSHEAPCSIHRFKLDRTRSVQFNLRFSQLTLSICIGCSPSHSHMWEVLLHMVCRRCSLQFSSHEAPIKYPLAGSKTQQTPN